MSPMIFELLYQKDICILDGHSSELMI
jgi:hypothetical protein